MTRARCAVCINHMFRPRCRMFESDSAVLQVLERLCFCNSPAFRENRHDGTYVQVSIVQESIMPIGQEHRVPYRRHHRNMAESDQLTAKTNPLDSPQPALNSAHMFNLLIASSPPPSQPPPSKTPSSPNTPRIPLILQPIMFFHKLQHTLRITQ